MNGIEGPPGWPLWARLSLMLGFPVTVAVVLLWFTLQTLTGAMRVMSTEHQEMTDVLRLICAHTAQTESGRDACYRPANR